MYNDHFDNSLLSSFESDRLSVTPPAYGSLGLYDRFNLNSGVIQTPAFNPVLEHRKVDTLGRICDLGGSPTGLRMDPLGQVRDPMGGIMDPFPGPAPFGP